MTQAVIGVLGGLLAGLLLAAGGAHAQCASTAACLQMIAAAQQDTRTFTARFVQTKYVSLLDEPLVSTGQFVFKRPDRVRLTIEQPQPATVVIDGARMYIPNLSERDRAALSTVPVASLFTQLGAIFTGSVQTLTDNFEVTATDDGTAIQLTITPRQAAWKRMFHTVALRFARPELMVQQIRLEDALGDRLEIALHDARRNSDVPDSLFTISEQ